jgi:predicted nucleotidyltransferase
MADRFTTSIRPYLLAGVLRFVRAARNVEGVMRIALIGSLATDKRNPKDADLLITIRHGTNLTPLATLGRKLQGHAQQRNHGGEVFLCAEEGVYLGRTCPWKDCRPFVRLRCDAQHCGRTSATTFR